MTDLRHTLRGAASLPWRFLGATGLHAHRQRPISFVVERRNWSIHWDGQQICEHLNTNQPGVAEVTTRPERITSGVAHFGSQFLWEVWHRHLSRQVRIVVTYFHGKPEDGPDMARHVDTFRRAIDQIDRVIVANTTVEQRLLDWGIRRGRLVRIPIGVDTVRFQPPSATQRIAARQAFGIPADRLAIGSFQKDGVGWGDGRRPKLVKGPDLFLSTIEQLAGRFPLHVLLTGPARGYVCNGLQRLGVPFTHHFLADYFEIIQAYQALDLYLMTSREEGGPKAILECAATGVPIVSSSVGMAPDVISDGQTGFLADAEDVRRLADCAAQLLTDAQLRSTIATAARAKVGRYDWRNVADRHYHDVYAPLLNTMHSARVA